MKLPIIGEVKKAEESKEDFKKLIRFSVLCPSCKHKWTQKLEAKRFDYIHPIKCPKCGKQIGVKVVGDEYEGLGDAKYHLSKLEQAIVMNYAKYNEEYKNKNMNFQDAMHDIFMQTNEMLQSLDERYSI